MLQPLKQMDAPIGIFDSGIGGLSVLRHVHQQLPHENLLYFADSGFAPYGDKPEQVIIERTLAIADYLLSVGCKALVVACNTATATAIHLLRELYPDTPIVGVEPGLKPAATSTKSRTVGVLATDRTIASEKFHLLRNQLTATTGVRFIAQACTGLASQVENGEIDSPLTKTLVQQYVAPLIKENVDTIVLGCTHYPFVQSQIEAAAKNAGAQFICIIDTGEPVARQLARLLEKNRLARTRTDEGTLKALTTGDPLALSTAFGKLLRLHPPVEQIAV